jgi:2',3'-cyclic-nucleotide 2'-phosphodiesterase (5'-nucleotidase family)
VVYEADGIQIGIIGAIGDCYSSISADKVQDVYFKTGSELTALVKAESQRLQSQGVDFIVYCLHDGFGSSNSTSSGVISDRNLASYYDVSLSNGYVDLVFEGHTHQGYALMDSYGVYHLQNRGDNRGGISHVEISFNTITGDFRVDAHELITTDSYDSLPDDPVVEGLLSKYEEQLAQGNRILGTNAVRRRSTMLRQLVAEQYYQLGLQVWGNDYEITLGGGFISIRSPYELPAGDVKYAQLQSLFPFDNDLVLCSIKGSDLLSKFINTGNSNYYISGDQALMRNVDPNGTYYVVVDTYTSSYAPNRLTVVETYTTGIYARDLLAEFIESGGLA